MKNKPKLVVVISGKKDSGKSTLANHLAAWYLNRQFSQDNPSSTEYWVNSFGKLMFRNPASFYEISVEQGIGSETWISQHGVRIIAFATPIKEFLIKVMGLNPSFCYGTNQQKNMLTSIEWDGLPYKIRRRYGNDVPTKVLGRVGRMTGREVMQVFGTDVMRKWIPSVWANGGFRIADEADEDLVIINDSRFYNEIDAGSRIKSATTTVLNIRLERQVHSDPHPSETAMDGICKSIFDVVVPDELSAAEQFGEVFPAFVKAVNETFKGSPVSV